jgi:hypothetical protein
MGNLNLIHAIYKHGKIQNGALACRLAILSFSCTNMLDGHGSMKEEVTIQGDQGSSSSHSQ